MTITMPRGDIKLVTFTVTDPGTGDMSDVEIQEIYFTVKKRFENPQYLFQKKLSDGSIVRVEGNSFQFSIEPEDTNGLGFGTYVFDIELVGDGLKDTTVGTFELTYEATHASNE